MGKISFYYEISCKKNDNYQHKIMQQLRDRIVKLYSYYNLMGQVNIPKPNQSEVPVVQQEQQDNSWCIMS